MQMCSNITRKGFYAEEAAKVARRPRRHDGKKMSKTASLGYIYMYVYMGPAESRNIQNSNFPTMELVHIGS